MKTNNITSTCVCGHRHTRLELEMFYESNKRAYIMWKYSINSHQLCYECWHNKMCIKDNSK